MRGDNKAPSVPPRLLLGAALLFWGAMVGQPIVGLICAFIVEGRSWLSLRWNFTDHGFVRAWWLSLLLILLALLWEWVGGESYLSLFAILQWLPLLFLPLIFVQQYALQRAFPLNTFSTVARRNMEHEREAGREVDPVLIHFGYIYLALVLIAASFGEVRRGGTYLVGLLLFGGTALFFASRQGRERPVGWVLSMLLASVIGYGGAVGLQRLYDYIESGEFFNRGRGFGSGDVSITSIGEIGRIKLSHEIRWRMEIEQGGVPGLLREAAFNNYSEGVWGYAPPAGRTREEDEKFLASRVDEDDRYVFDERDYGADQAAGIGEVLLTGAANTRGNRTTLPLPAGARLLDNLRVDGADFTSLGTTIAVNQKVPVFRFTAYHSRGSRREEFPYEQLDLAVPESDRAAVRKVVEELGLRELPQRAALARLRQFFVEEFEYTLYQRIPAWVPRRERRSMAYFLETSRRGHCEYFATAAALILREAGIPVRYATGYAAKEQNGSGEWVLRGQHGHAWCRVYLGGERTVETEQGTQDSYLTRQGGEWVDFDPTPPNWLALEGSGVPWEQRVRDWWQNLRQELLLWRTQQGIQAKVSWGMALIGALLLAYVVIRLWRNQVVERGVGDSLARDRVRIERTSPLARLLRPARKILGARGPGQPLSEWLMGLAAHRPTLAEPLHEIAMLYWKDRFDSLGLTQDEGDRLRDLCRTVKRQL